MNKLVVIDHSNIQLQLQSRLNELVKENITITEICIVSRNKELFMNQFSNAYVTILVVDQDISLLQQEEKIKVFMNNLIQPDDRIFFWVQDDTDFFLQHMVTHFCISIYKNQCVLLNNRKQKYFNYLKNNHEQDEIKNLHLHIKELISSGNYHSALQLAMKYKNSHVLKQLVQFGDQLFCMDFSSQSHFSEKEPLKALIEVLINTGIGETEEIQYLQSLALIKDGNQKAFLAYLYNFAEFLYEQNKIIDFIVLYYRLVEETLLYALGWDVDDYSNFRLRKDARYTLDIPKVRLTKHFRRYENVLKVYIQNLENEKNIKIRLGKESHLERLNSKELYFANLYLFFRNNAIKECIDFRHEGISGHGFANLTKMELEEICEGKTPLQLIQPLLEQQDLYPEYSIFKSLNKAIVALLKEVG